MRSARITVGSEIFCNSEYWKVTGLNGSVMWLRRTDSNETVVADISVALTAPDLQIVNEPAAAETAAGSAALVSQVADAAGESAAAEKLRVVNLIMTGFEDGDAGPGRGPGDVEVGPASGHDLDARVAVAAARVGRSPRTVFRWLRRFETGGPGSLLDLRQVVTRDPLKNCSPELRVVIVTVLDAYTNQSRVTDNELIRRVRQAATGEGVRVPSDGTLRKYLRELRAGRGHRSPTQTKRDLANRPTGLFHRYVPTRPFDVVEIDSTPLDVLAYSPEEDILARVVLTIAIDMYSRSIVAWRVTLNDPTSEDVGQLLYDMMRPKTMRAGWTESARWKYGIPAHLVLPNSGSSDGTGDGSGVELAGVPSGVPAEIAADNGTVFRSHQFQQICARFGISLAYARVHSPTDKGHVEALFRRIRQQFVQYLPGFKGNAVHSRGDSSEVEDKACLTVLQIEELFAEWVATIYQNAPHDSLRTAGMSRYPLTPNTMYDIGVANSGWLPVPVNHGLLIDFLHPEFRAVTREGVEYQHIRYDSDVLDPYRNRKCPFGSTSTWPLRVDRRDLSQIWFWDGDTVTDGEWVPIPAVLPSGQRPFASNELDYVARRVQRAEKPPTHHQMSKTIQAELEAFLNRAETGVFLDAKEERVAATGRAKVRQSTLDGISTQHRIHQHPDTTSNDFTGLADAINTLRVTTPLPAAFDPQDVAS